MCVALGDEPIETARHGHRRAWTERGGPWLGLGRAGGVAVVSTCHLIVDGYGHALITARIAELTRRWTLPVTIGPDDIDIVDGHVGAGYAKSRPEELATIRDLCRRDGLVLDPVYSGKAFHGMVTELARDPARFGERVVFVHTGGIFGLFPAAAAFAPLL